VKQNNKNRGERRKEREREREREKEGVKRDMGLVTRTRSCLLTKAGS
jgi:hypothetical protein